MSWFDATGIASLAKTALKEAQKTIDKALDIQEDEGNANSENANESTSSANVDAPVKKAMKQSVSNPILSTAATAASAASANNIWGSFTGSFFDTSKKDENAAMAVTIAPTSTSSEAVKSRLPSSAGSASESVEMLSCSPLTTPSSNATSPSSSEYLSSLCYMHIKCDSLS